jgi:hypothetical protein
MRQKAKEFYEWQLHDNTSVIGRLDKDEVIELMAAFAQQQVKNLNIPDVRFLLPDDKELATEVVVRFITRNPHPKSKIYLEYEKKAFINGAKWMQEEILKRNVRQ